MRKYFVRCNISVYSTFNSHRYDTKLCRAGRFLLHRIPDMIRIDTGGSNQTGVWLQGLASVVAAADYNTSSYAVRNRLALTYVIQVTFKVIEIIFKAVERPLVSVFHTCLAVLILPNQTMSCSLKFVDEMVWEIVLDRNWQERVAEPEAISKLIGWWVVYLDSPH